jgi:hypothetical protein
MREDQDRVEPLPRPRRHPASPNGRPGKRGRRLSPSRCSISPNSGSARGAAAEFDQDKGLREQRRTGCDEQGHCSAFHARQHGCPRLRVAGSRARRPALPEVVTGYRSGPASRVVPAFASATSRSPERQRGAIALPTNSIASLGACRYATPRADNLRRERRKKVVLSPAWCWTACGVRAGRTRDGSRCVFRRDGSPRV